MSAAGEQEGPEAAAEGKGEKAKAGLAIGANLYPWDVVGDPACPERVAGIGVDRVALAAAYHSVRALTPRHPGHKVVTAAHSAVYYRPDPLRWHGSMLQPAEATWAYRTFPSASAALQATGMKVYAWTVLAHNQRLSTLHSQHAVTNAFGDKYSWALCINSPEVRAYCALLAAEVAEQPHIDGVELESCGWYGFDHLHAHDKTGGVHLDAATKRLMNLCFCAACEHAYADLGLDGIRADVRRALNEVFEGRRESADPTEGEFADHLAEVGTMRVAAAARLRTEAVSAIRKTRPDLPVLIHASHDPLAVGANPGCSASQDYGAVLQCGVRSDAALDGLRTYVAATAEIYTSTDSAHSAQPVAATVNIVAGLGGNRADLAAWCTELRDAGADELRFYHAGLASTADLAAAGDVVRAL